MSKFYCVYMAYAKYEVMDSSMEGYDELPTYPRDCARVRIYDNPGAQLDAYANILFCYLLIFWNTVIPFRLFIQ